MSRHGAKIGTSPRLQSLLALLRDEKRHSSMEIIEACNTVNPATTVADLRDNGAEITCEREKAESGATVAYYTMTKGPAV